MRISDWSSDVCSSDLALARWVTDAPDAMPTSSSYRSTRRMLGRLEVRPTGQFAIRYSLMDGHSLKFDDERRDDSPFVPDPFPAVPGGMNPEDGPAVRMRGIGRASWRERVGQYVEISGVAV